MDTFFRIFILTLLLSSVLALPLDKFEDNNSYDVGEYGDYFEGDMILTEEQRVAIFAHTYNGKIDLKYRWKNRTVPYTFTSDHTEIHQSFIELALRTIESVSCLRFVRRTHEEDYIEIIDEGRGCSSHVGRKGGKQLLKLRSNEIGHGCFRFGTIIHEFLHALGFHHMQSAYDRDEYVTIHWENIRKGKEHNFRKHLESEVTYFNTTYDYYSVMHYSAYGFSVDRRPTIVPTDESYLNVIGQRKGMSHKDILKLNRMYGCD